MLSQGGKMNCQQFQQHCSAILDGDADAAQEMALLHHLKTCGACSTHLQHYLQMKRLLRAMPAPPPDAGLAARILAQRNERSLPTSRTAARFTMVAAMLAAGIAYLAVTALLPWGQPAAGGDQISARLAADHSLHLVLNSTDELQQVTFVVITPDNLALEGFASTHRVEWTGQLKKGRNLVSLPIVAVGDSAGKIIMEISHGNEHKRFAVQINGDSDDHV